jgi:hypothetical protein
MRRSLFLLWFALAAAACAQDVSVAAFHADVTPPPGSPLVFGVITPAREIVDPLSARGIVLLGAGKPLVLVAVDWVGIGNQGHAQWRRALAEAAGTTPDRVTVHTLHQHDTPAYDPDAERLLERHGLAGRIYNVEFAARAIERTAQAAAAAMKQPQPVTHIAFGKARVEQVASNRRISGPDGRVKHVRYSSCLDTKVRAEPEGVIDPLLRSIAFWNADRPVAVLTYYATHPQSYYGEGGVSADFVGMARAAREKAVPAAMHIHFNGAGGNVAAGKYNDGSPAMRPVLASRIEEGMRAAWQSSKKHPLRARDIGWRTSRVILPPAERLRDRAAIEKALADFHADMRTRLRAARELAWLDRGHQAELSCLRLGRARVLHMPGELFVEYQLAAAKMRPEALVAMAAYADYAPGYIGTRISYRQGGYETGTPSRTAPEVEDVLMHAMRKLLK